MPVDGRLDREARLVEPQPATQVARHRSRGLEIAPPGGEAVVRLVVVDQRQVVQGNVAVPSRRRHEGGRADRKDLLVHEVLDLAVGMVLGAADRNVVGALVEVRGRDHGRDADVDLRRNDEEPSKPGHQPERGDGGRSRDRDLLAAPAAVERQQRRFELVEPFRKVLQGARRCRCRHELAAFALEQRGVEEVFERPDLVADGRGSDAEFGGRARQAEVACGGLESAQRVEGEIGPHAPSSDRCRPPSQRFLPPARLHGTSRGTRPNFSQGSQVRAQPALRGGRPAWLAFLPLSNHTRARTSGGLSVPG